MSDEIHRVLVLSTAHLPKPITEENAPDPIWYEKGEYGWLVFTQMFRDPADTMPELVFLLEYAQDCDCDWVMFDCDGPRNPDLPVFHW